jgi:hypothetical protein
MGNQENGDFVGLKRCFGTPFYFGASQEGEIELGFRQPPFFGSRLIGRFRFMEKTQGFVVGAFMVGFLDFKEEFSADIAKPILSFRQVGIAKLEPNKLFQGMNRRLLWIDNDQFAGLIAGENDGVVWQGDVYRYLGRGKVAKGGASHICPSFGSIRCTL